MKTLLGFHCLFLYTGPAALKVHLLVISLYNVYRPTIRSIWNYNLPRETLLYCPFLTESKTQKRTLNFYCPASQFGALLHPRPGIDPSPLRGDLWTSLYSLLLWAICRKGIGP